MATILTILVIAAGLTPLIQRDLRRAVARRRFRRQFEDIRAAYVAFSASIGAALIPAIRKVARAAADMERAIQQIAEAMETGRK